MHINFRIILEAHSCRHLQSISMFNNNPLPDGVYEIYPHGLSKPPIKTYCDMSRDGGGWTLLVTSHTNTWTAADVTLRNPDKPSLTADFSILKYADDIKNHPNVIGGTFEYRLEADRPGLYRKDPFVVCYFSGIFRICMFSGAR